MIIAVNLVYYLATAALAPFFSLMALVTASALLGRRNRPAAAEGRARFLIVIPAHDEEGAIGATVRSCRAIDYEPGLFSIHVIADNCSDRTADEAREAGAVVVERHDPELRSKGHALEYFFTRIPDGRPDAGYDAAVLIDADTVVDAGLLRVFDRSLAEGKDWAQGYYTVRNPDASWRTRMMTYAFSLANGVWLLGLDRLGLSVGLKGNGMCFSAKGLRRFPWRAHGLVEDMEFALMLRVEGERVRFEPEARVFGEMVSKGGPGAASQRRRWEAGRRSLRGKFAVPLATSPSLGIFRRMFYLIDVFFPPLVTLVLILVMTASVHVLAALTAGFSIVSRHLLPIHGAMLAVLLTYGISPFLALKLPSRYLLSLLCLPYYVGWKIVIGLGKGPQNWVRTPREPQSPA